MKRALNPLPGFLILLSFSAQAEPETSAAGSPLIKASPARGWSAGAALSFARRELRVDGALMATDLRNITARVGIDLIPSVHPWVEAGAVKADRDDFEGENGPTWAVGVDANLIEFIVAGHPSMPRKKILRLQWVFHPSPIRETASLFAGDRQGFPWVVSARRLSSSPR